MVKYRLRTEAFRRSSKRSWFEKVLILGNLTTDKFGRSVDIGIVVGVGGAAGATAKASVYQRSTERVSRMLIKDRWSCFVRYSFVRPADRNKRRPTNLRQSGFGSAEGRHYMFLSTIMHDIIKTSGRVR